MRVHFLYLHVQYIVVILEEGNLPYPWFPQYDMLVPWRTFNGRHPATSQCARGAEQKIRRLSEEELKESTERAFKAYGEPLENTTTYTYLVQVMTEGDDDWTEVVGKLQKARNIWGRLLRILSREGEDTKVSGNFSRR